MKQPVSIVIPMYNAAPYIQKVIQAIFAQDYEGEVELIVVNDGSKDNSLQIVKDLQSTYDFRIIDQENQGAVTATNKGIKASSRDIICSVDSDVVLHSDWLSKIMEEFHDPRVGAVQGYYKTPPGISFIARMMGYDIEARYNAVKDKYVTHVCTGDTAYRKSALDQTGLFDAQFTYAYDNDMSYRLVKAGYKLVFRKDALCDHYWKADFKKYVRQQYWLAYGRMQLIDKHKDRITGDSVSGLRMILQVPLTLFFLITFAGGVFLLPLTSLSRLLFGAAFAAFTVFFIDRLCFTVGIYSKQKDITAFLLPFIYFLRNMVWCWALIRWGMRKK